ncbi:MAG TPA: hypothetical protein VM345_11345 [Acidimicrobiales bacterium]|jgi:hypothetical protein|nr:hypothetical protein [Acidimicrobiales bacterium]
MSRRSPAFVAALVAMTLALVTVSAACSSSDDEDAVPTTTTTTELTAQPTLAWTIGEVDPQGTAPPAEDVIAAVKATLDAYLAQAIVGPLYTGQPAGDLSAVLSPAALERIAADPAARATLVDEGMPPATKEITATVANAGLRTVAGPDGAVAVVGAHLDLVLHAVGPAIDVDIVRKGEVILTQENGSWRIDSFQLRTQRDSRA